MKIAGLIARYALGLLFLVTGLNGFLNFLPAPEFAPPAMNFMKALLDSGYFFPVLKITEASMGILLLAGLYVPLALTILAPVVLNIFLFHLFLAPSGMPIAIAVLALELFSAWTYRSYYKQVLTMKATLK